MPEVLYLGSIVDYHVEKLNIDSVRNKEFLGEEDILVEDEVEV